MQRSYIHTGMWDKAWNSEKFSAEMFATKEGPRIISVNIL